METDSCEGERQVQVQGRGSGDDKNKVERGDRHPGKGWLGVQYWNARIKVDYTRYTLIYLEMVFT